jgi:uncharacterized damage-inducible protein DinB
MAADLGTQFQERIDVASARLEIVTEAQSNQLIREGGWSRKEVLGHLIDSALNNHQRFVRAALDGHYEGPSYDQKGWIALHGYGELGWTALLEHWRKQNELLARVVARIPNHRLDANCQVRGDLTSSLSHLVVDYLNHLETHVAQIVPAEPGPVFLAFSIEKLNQMRDFVGDSLARLTDEQVWRKDNQNCNAIGNLILHLCGNVEQWIGHGIGGAKDHRQRDAEFTARGGQSAAELAARFDSTIDRAIAILTALPANRLIEKINPQDGEVTILEAIYRVTGHLQQHVGQILMMTKQLTGQDLNLYKPKP